jgi:histo-blood group ABO system transferase
VKIGVLTIATHKYISFIPELYRGLDKYLIPHDKILFTDQDYPHDKIVKIEHEGWPNVTLKRFHYFCGAADLLSQYDYLLYLDADTIVVDHIGEEIIGNRMGALHPAFYNMPPTTFTYETDPKSTACTMNGARYYYGAINGGKKFLDMAHTLRDNVQKDLDNGIVAIWHDESHLNKYYADNPPDVVLDPSYCFPQGWGLPFTPKIIVPKKNHAAMRSWE